MRNVARTAASTAAGSLAASRNVGSRASDAPASGARTTGRTAASNTRSFRDGAAEGSGRPASGGGRASGRGFNAWNKRVKDTSKDFTTWSVPEDKVKVIAFLEPENYEMVFRHWVPTVTDSGKTVRVPRNCIEDPDNDVRCPLCDVADEPKPVGLWNIVDLDEPGKVQLWEAGKEVMKRIEKLWKSLQEVPEDKGGPLELNSEGVYAAVSREQKDNGYWEYTIVRVKERDLDDDYGLEALSEEGYEALLTKLNKSEDIKFNTVQELRELADKLTD